MSSATATIDISDVEPSGSACCKVIGEIRFDSIMELLEQMSGLFTQVAKEITVDLAGVTRTNSAGVSFLIESTRMARVMQKNIHWVNVPAEIKAIIEVCDLSAILPLGESG